MNTPAYKLVLDNRMTSLSLIYAIRSTGILDYEQAREPVNETVFKEFPRLVLIPNSYKKERYFVMNNVSFHKCKGFLELCEQNDLILKYLPAYTPQLNLIENFGVLK